MMKINIGQYIVGDSLMHRADPRTKIILTFLFLMVVLIIDSFIGFLICFAFVTFAVLSSGIQIRSVLRGMKPIFFLLLITVTLNVFTIPGKELISIGIFKITDQGIIVSLKTAFRLLLLVSGASLLTFVTTPTVLTDGIESLLNPLKRFKIPVHEFAMMMTIALRFIPTLLEESDKIIKAQSARGADFDNGNIFKRVKAYVPIIIPLLIGSFMRANELATAMEARCYKGGEGRTRMKVLAFSRDDIILVLVFAVLTGLELMIRFYPNMFGFTII